MIYHEIRTIVFLDDFRLFIFYLLCKIYNTNSITEFHFSRLLFARPLPIKQIFKLDPRNCSTIPTNRILPRVDDIRRGKNA